MTCTFHNYRTIHQTHEAVVEICVMCKRRNVIRFDSRGNYDKRKHDKEHAADTLQPGMRGYDRVYKQ